MATGRLWFLLVVWVLQAALIGLLVSASWLRSQLEYERILVARTMGPASSAMIADYTESWYQTLVVDTGVVAASYRWLLPDDSPGRPHTGMEELAPWLFQWLEQRLDAFWWLVYQGMFRWVQMELWLPYLSMVLAAAAFDGAMQREIKKRTAGYASAVRYDLGFYSLAALLVMPLLYLSMPLAVHPLVIPVWAVMGAGVLNLIGANVQKRL